MDEPIYLNSILEVKSYRLIQSRVAEVVRGCGINSVSEWFVLAHVSSKPQSRAADLTSLLGVEAPLITVLTDKLEKAKLIRRKPHRTDKRVKVLQVTPAGKNKVNEIDEALKNTLGKLLKGVTEEDLQSYKRVLEAIVKNGED